MDIETTFQEKLQLDTMNWACLSCVKHCSAPGKSEKRRESMWISVENQGFSAGCGIALQVLLQLTYAWTLSEDKLPYVPGGMYEPLKWGHARMGGIRSCARFP